MKSSIHSLFTEHQNRSRYSSRRWGSSYEQWYPFIFNNFKDPDAMVHYLKSQRFKVEVGRSWISNQLSKNKLEYEMNTGAWEASALQMEVNEAGWPEKPPHLVAGIWAGVVSGAWVHILSRDFNPQIWMTRRWDKQVVGRGKVLGWSWGGAKVTGH